MVHDLSTLAVPVLYISVAFVALGTVEEGRSGEGGEGACWLCWDVVEHVVCVQGLCGNGSDDWRASAGFGCRWVDIAYVLCFSDCRMLLRRALPLSLRLLQARLAFETLSLEMAHIGVRMVTVLPVNESKVTVIRTVRPACAIHYARATVGPMRRRASSSTLSRCKDYELEGASMLPLTYHCCCQKARKVRKNQEGKRK